MTSRRAGLVFSSLLLGCSGFTARVDQGGGATDARVERSDLAFASGAGPHGSLPTGYCCSSDLECRQRHCGTVGGVRMCQDSCQSVEACDARHPGFTCQRSDAGGPGLCVPTGPPSCIPALSFPRGTRRTGQCCDPLHSGLTGMECDGNHCISAWDDGNPWICSNACAFAKDCPTGHECFIADAFYKLCFPSAKSYSCTP